MLRTVQSGRMLSAIAMIASLAILMWSLGYPSISLVHGAQLTQVSDTVSDSAPSALSSHDIEFTIPTSGEPVNDGDDITFTFNDGFTGANTVTANDVDLLVDGVQVATTSWSVGTNATQVSLTMTNGFSIGAGSTTRVVIGSGATDYVQGVDRITNPSAEGSATISILTTGGGNNEATAMVAILDDVLVTAAVNSVLEFTVSGTPTSTSVGLDSTADATSSTTIPFGDLGGALATVMAQELAVETNAANGYIVTVHSDGHFESGGEYIDAFIDGSDVSTPTGWTAPLGSIGNSMTHGHWGVTTDDENIQDRATQFTAGTTFVAVSSTTPRSIMGHTGPVNGTGVGLGTTTVGYKVEISAFQAAGSYSTQLTYVVTPTF